MRNIILKVAIKTLNLFYFFIKFLKTQQKITLISRLNNQNSIDFTVLIDFLKISLPNYKIVALNRKLDKNFKSKIKYIPHMFIQMYHIATSRLIIIDSYCICISVLNHKKSLKTIQIWHAVGAFKKFGYSILDKEEGSESLLAKIMGMHKNYDYIIISSNYVKPYIQEAFNVNDDKLLVSLLPRINYLQNYHNELKTKILSTYSLLNNSKKNILYAPTFRKDGTNFFKIVINNIDYSKYNLIIKQHSGKEKIYINGKLKYSEESQFGIELLCVADHIITDYSAIMYETMILNKPLYFYVPDLENYEKKRGFYFNYKQCIPGVISNEIKTIMKAISLEKQLDDKYRLMLEQSIDKNSDSIENFILKIIEGVE